MSTQLLEPPAEFTAFHLAEWLETTMVLEGIDRLSQTEIEDRMASGQGPGASVIEELAGEIGRRAQRAPTVYPFRAADEEIFIDATVDGTVYLFLLILSMNHVPYRMTSKYNVIGPWLELITREAGIAVLGATAEGRRFGWPGDGRPEHLIAAVIWLAEEMGLTADEAALEKTVDEDDKDGGVDVAVWNGLGDTSPNFPVCLFQVTVQDRWEKKSFDVEPDRWRTWLALGRNPSVGLAVPHAVDPDSKVRGREQFKSDWFLDRFRLCALVADRNLRLVSEYAEIQAWTKAEVALIVDEIVNPPAADPTSRRKKKTPSIARLRRPTKTAEQENRGLRRESDSTT